MGEAKRAANGRLPCANALCGMLPHPLCWVRTSTAVARIVAWPTANQRAEWQLALNRRADALPDERALRHGPCP